MNTLWLVVLGMAIVTYIPRMIPLVFLTNGDLPPVLKRFLAFVPYAVLASLIFPGILTSVNHTESAIAGGVVSIILSLFHVNIIVVVIGGILGVFFVDQILF